MYWLTVHCAVSVVTTSGTLSPGGVQVSVAAKPLKVAACISVRADQAVGRRRGKLAAVFHNDLNSIRAAAQLAAAKVKGNGLQPVRAQCVSVQDFKDGAETDERVGVRSIVAVPVAGRRVPAAAGTTRCQKQYPVPTNIFYSSFGYIRSFLFSIVSHSLLWGTPRSELPEPIKLLPTDGARRV